MYVKKDSIDRQFARDIEFLEYKYDVIITLQRELNSLYANVCKRSTLETVAVFFIGDNADTKERMYVRLSRQLKALA